LYVYKHGERSDRNCRREWAEELVGGGSSCHGDFDLERENPVQG
jgi:hypothetical protein